MDGIKEIDFDLYDHCDDWYMYKQLMRGNP